MTGITEDGGVRRRNHWRIVAWSAAAILFFVPLMAMQITDEVVWEVADFVIFGALLLGAGVIYELAVRRREGTAYRLAAGVALGAAFLLVWLNGAVGIIGSENNRANLMYGAVLAVGVIGAVIARFRPQGMARTLLATAIAQASVAVIALVAGLSSPASGPFEIIALNGLFVALFGGSALLFRRAAGQCAVR